MRQEDGNRRTSLRLPSVVVTGRRAGRQDL
jgi:hypothetical protein